MILNRWREDIRNWVHCKTRSIAELSRVKLDESEYFENPRELWSIVTDSHDKAGNYADFNAYVISHIINDTWGYEIVRGKP